MPREFHRSSRVAQAIHRVLAERCGRFARDERLQQVTVTHVDVSRDLGVAKVHYTLREPERAAEIADALSASAGFLRREVAQQIRLRATPQLRFVRDESLERGERLSALIDEARARDRRGGDASDHGDD